MVNYLNLRTADLDNLERNMLLMIDEIYISKRTDYCGAQIYGLTYKGEDIATTMLCFMIKSVSGKYKDIIPMFPVRHLATADVDNIDDEESCLNYLDLANRGGLFRPKRFLIHFMHSIFSSI